MSLVMAALTEPAPIVQTPVAGPRLQWVERLDVIRYCRLLDDPAFLASHT